MEILVCRLKYLSLIAKKTLLKSFYMWKLVKNKPASIFKKKSICSGQNSPFFVLSPEKNIKAPQHKASKSSISNKSSPNKIFSPSKQKIALSNSTVFDQLKATLQSKAGICEIPEGKNNVSGKNIERKSLQSGKMHKRGKTQIESNLAVVSSTTLNPFKINFLTDKPK